jgi:hypothetical protein
LDVTVERPVLEQLEVEAAGGDLKDDASALCLDWQGGPEREGASAGGANANAARPSTSNTPRTVSAALTCRSRAQVDADRDDRSGRAGEWSGR